MSVPLAMDDVPPHSRFIPRPSSLIHEGRSTPAPAADVTVNDIKAVESDKQRDERIRLKAIMDETEAEWGIDDREYKFYRREYETRIKKPFQDVYEYKHNELVFRFSRVTSNSDYDLWNELYEKHMHWGDRGTRERSLDPRLLTVDRGQIDGGASYFKSTLDTWKEYAYSWELWIATAGTAQGDIEMFVTSTTGYHNPLVVHMGIQRNSAYNRDPPRDPPLPYHSNLSPALHAFAAAAMLRAHPEKVYMVSTPVRTMCEILLAAFHGNVHFVHNRDNPQSGSINSPWKQYTKHSQTRKYDRRRDCEVVVNESWREYEWLPPDYLMAADDAKSVEPVYSVRADYHSMPVWLANGVSTCPSRICMDLRVLGDMTYFREVLVQNCKQMSPEKMLHALLWLTKSMSRPRPPEELLEILRKSPPIPQDKLLAILVKHAHMSESNLVQVLEKYYPGTSPARLRELVDRSVQSER